MANPFIPYYIILDRSVLPEQLTYPQGILLSPSDAAAQYNASIVYAAGSGVPPPNNFSPRIGVPTLPTTSLLTIGVTSATFPTGYTVDEDGVRHVQSSSLGGTIEWRGFFFTEIPNAITDRDAIQTRYWADGFEIPTLGDGGTGGGGGTTRFNRDASRTLDGLGYAYRGGVSGTKTHLGSATNYTWERMYLRVRRLSTSGTSYFWHSISSAHSPAAIIAGLTTSGLLEFYSLGAQVAPGTLIGSIAIPATNQWFRLDILYRFATSVLPSPNDSITVYVTDLDGTRSFSGHGSVGGMNEVGTHVSSSVGAGVDGSTANTGEIDIDDWSGYSFPLTFGYNGLDWVSGSHVRAILPTGFGSTHTTASWAGDYRILVGNPVIGQVSGEAVVASASGVTLDVTSNYADYNLGCTALTVAYFNHGQSSVGTANLGYSSSATGQSVTAVTVAQDTWKATLFSLGGVVTPTPLSTVNLIYQKNSAGNESVQVLQATAEFLGSFGPEDDPSQLWPPRAGMHNAPWWDQSFAQEFTHPSSPVSVMSGTYTGNGTGQDIAVTTPIHWFWCRPLTSNTGGAHWWSTMLAGHDSSIALPLVNRFIRAYRTPASGAVAGTYKIQISGASAQCNANGVTYQWVGFSDLGMRYLLNGVGAHSTADATFTNILPDTGFTPEAAFLLRESSATTADSQFYKGPGHTTDNASPITAAQVSAVATLGAGNIVTKTATLNINDTVFAYSAWRSNDGVTTGPVAITSYTGDGTGNRTIAVVLGSRYPHFALVVPHGGVSYFRDPSHTTTTSESVIGSQVSTAIRGGGANQLLVGSTLNANAVVYDVFVLAGDLTGGGSGGWSGNPTDPLEPIFPVPTVVPTAPGAWAPTDTKGWWMSTNGFGGNADLITTPLNPKHPRHWDKIAAFATSTSGMLGGSPGAGVTYNNHLIYAGDDYTLATTAPTIRIFDGTSDRLLVTVPPVTTTPSRAVVSMILVGTTIYFTTLDSGTTSANFAGRVFALDILSGNVTQVGSGFSGGEVPYALVYHMGRLWLGTNKGNGTAGTVYFLRPGIDTAWTTDRTLSTDSAGGACSMFSYKGTLYVGCDAASGTASKVLARSGVGAWTTSHTAATTAQNNGHLSMMEFLGNLYVGYWNNSSTSLIKRFDGTTWTSVYSGATTTIRPYIGMFVSDDILFVVGGGNALSASLVSSVDGTIWDNNTPFLTGPTTETALPIFGVIGV